AAEQLTRALAQIGTLPATPALRREEIKLQVALVSPLFQVKGFAAPETKAAVERAHLLIQQAEALGEPPEDPLVPFSVLYCFWVVTFVGFDGDDLREIAVRILDLAEKQGSTVPLMVGHRCMGITLTFTGDIAGSCAHFDQALRLYVPAEHRSLTTRFGSDIKVSNLIWRALARWLLGYPEAALADVDHALKEAREIGQAATLMFGQAATLMFALANTSYTLILCGTYEKADTNIDQLLVLADEKGSSLRKAEGRYQQGCVLALTSKASDAVQMITSGITAWRSTGATMWMPFVLSYLARAYAEIGQFGDASRTIGEAITAVETSQERWCEAEVHRAVGEIALESPEPDVVKAEASFKHALAVARAQQAKSWELRAAMSMARLWREQGKRNEARDLLAPVYGWFTEGFDTLDLRQAKGLLDELTP